MNRNFKKQLTRLGFNISPRKRAKLVSRLRFTDWPGGASAWRGTELPKVGRAKFVRDVICTRMVFVSKSTENLIMQIEKK